MKTAIEQPGKNVACLQWRRVYPGLILVLLTFFAYWGVWNNGFINYDDSDYFFKNHHVLTGISAGIGFRSRGCH